MARKAPAPPVDAATAYAALLKYDCPSGVSEPDRRTLIKGKTSAPTALVARLRRLGCLPPVEVPPPPPKAPAKAAAKATAKAAAKPTPVKAVPELRMKQGSASKTSANAPWAIEIAPPKAAASLGLSTNKLGRARDLARIDGMLLASLGLPAQRAELLQALSSFERAEALFIRPLAGDEAGTARLARALASLPPMTAAKSLAAFRAWRSTQPSLWPVSASQGRHSQRPRAELQAMRAAAERSLPGSSIAQQPAEEQDIDMEWSPAPKQVTRPVAPPRGRAIALAKRGIAAVRAARVAERDERLFPHAIPKKRDARGASKARVHGALKALA